MSGADDARFESFVLRSHDGCWEWLGALTSKGYGHFVVAGRRPMAHRYSYERFVGPIPEGMTIDHRCENRRCVNPDHLRVATNQENVLRGCGPTARNARKTHCSRGHAFTPENTRIKTKPRYARVCRTCERAPFRRRTKELSHG